MSSSSVATHPVEVTAVTRVLGGHGVPTQVHARADQITVCWIGGVSVTTVLAGLPDADRDQWHLDPHHIAYTRTVGARSRTAVTVVLQHRRTLRRWAQLWLAAWPSPDGHRPWLVCHLDGDVGARAEQAAALLCAQLPYPAGTYYTARQSRDLLLGEHGDLLAAAFADTCCPDPEAPADSDW